MKRKGPWVIIAVVACLCVFTSLLLFIIEDVDDWAYSESESVVNSIWGVQTADGAIEGTCAYYLQMGGDYVYANRGDYGQFSKTFDLTNDNNLLIDVAITKSSGLNRANYFAQIFVGTNLIWERDMYYALGSTTLNLDVSIFTGKQPIILRVYAKSSDGAGDWGKFIFDDPQEG
ncbi:hypothetical protein ES703_33631 [subsurface metagenome]